MSREIVRCGIYTRVLTDNGLDQEFNSLDAQYEASSAYIKSQALPVGCRSRPAMPMAASRGDQPTGRRCSACWRISGPDRDLFDRVQTMLSDQRSHQTRTRSSLSHLLTGLMFDAAGHRMAPTQAQKKGRHYSYYVSRPLLFGNAATAAVGSVSRVPAPDIDDQVRKVVLEPRHKSTSPIDNTYASLLIERIEVQQTRLVVQLKQNPDNPAEEDHSTIVIPWTKPPSKRARSILRPTSAKLLLRPMKLERRATLVAAIARGRRWLGELITDSSSDAQAIATRERCSLRYVNMTLSLAFLSPALTKAAVVGIGLEQLRELPAGWDRQFETLGLDPM